MLGITSSSPLYGHLALLRLDAIRYSLFQQTMKLNPILDFYFTTGVDRGGFQRFSSLIVACLTGLLDSVDNGGLVERSLVIYIDLPAR
jgi:hypothetical protein